MIFKRPWIIFVLAVGFSIFSLVAFIRFYEALALRQVLASLPVTVSPLYLALTGLFWGIFGVITVVGLWRIKKWGLNAARILAVTYAGYYWINQVFVGTSEIRSSNWPFLGGVTVVLLAAVLGSLAHPAVNNFYGEDDDQKKQS